MGPDPIRPRPACFFILTLLLLAAPTPSESFLHLFTNYETLFSLSHSLMTRVANLRTSRGDAAVASRARLLAEMLETGRNLGCFFGLARPIVFQNARNLASFETLSDVNELMRCVSELTRLDSDEDRTAWARRNYGDTLTVLKTVLAKPGPTFKEVVVIMERELVEGVFTNYETLFSLSHSLVTRVANLRTSRGDAAGASRARLLAEKLETGRNLGFVGLARSIVFQNARNLASFETLSDVNELMKCVSKLTRLDSDEDRTAWARRNYGNTLTVLKSRFSKLLEVLAKSGPFKEVVVIMQRELVEGELMKDCFEVVSNDMKGISEIINFLNTLFLE